jgi:hypothetical protein
MGPSAHGVASEVRAREAPASMPPGFMKSPLWSHIIAYSSKSRKKTGPHHRGPRLISTSRTGCFRAR